MGAATPGAPDVGERQVSLLRTVQSTQKPRRGDTAYRYAINRDDRAALPHAIRVWLAAKPGDKVLWTLLNNETIVLRSKAALLAELAGALADLAGQRSSSKTDCP